MENEDNTWKICRISAIDSNGNEIGFVYIKIYVADPYFADVGLSIAEDLDGVENSEGTKFSDMMFLELVKEAVRHNSHGVITKLQPELYRPDNPVPEEKIVRFIQRQASRGIITKPEFSRTFGETYVLFEFLPFYETLKDEE